MSKKLKINLLIIFIITFLTALLAGCSVGRESWEDTLKGYDAYGQSVTYYANEGKFENSLYEKSVYYVAGSNVFNIGVDSSSQNRNVTRNNYVLAGWEYAELDDEGNPVYQDAENAEAYGMVKSSGVAVDFDTLTIEANQKLYLVAKWTPDYRIEYILVSDLDISIKNSVTDADGNTSETTTIYKSGDTILEQLFGTFTSTTLYADKKMPTAEGSTFVQLYADAECTIEISGTVEKPTDTSAENPKVYAKYISGEWTVVKDAVGVVSMFGGLNSATKYYISNDIDCTGKSASLIVAAKKTLATVEGNGHTLSNLTFNVSASAGLTYSIFGTLGATASLKDLTLKDITYSSTIRTGSVNYYIVYADALEGAEAQNVVIDGVTVSISGPDTVTINGTPITSGVDLSGHIFGGDNVISGITVSNIN
jgi:hypothetical protein